jgi:uracil-DNA glycosylase family 4
MTLPAMQTSDDYNQECRACPRLALFLDGVKRENPDYFAKPVPPFGAANPHLLIVGLAPGMHGANRTGRPFTGDFAGILLYETLYKFGYASQPRSERADDELRLIGCRISNAVKCLPPENKPIPEEIKTCNRYLAAEIGRLPRHTMILALGQIAHVAVLMAHQLKKSAYRFGHAAQHILPDGRLLFDSYHCSRYNTQTKRLTTASFEAIFAAIRDQMEKRRCHTSM